MTNPSIHFGKSSQSSLITLSLILLVLIGYLDVITGPEISFTIFYLLPISLAVWFVGRWAGVLISTASAMTWFAADWLSAAVYSHFAIPYWNAIVFFGFFLVITFILSALKTALLHEKELARTDDLTGVANRRAFFELADREVNRAGRYNRPFSMAYMDIDDFKLVNDLFGHSTGDNLLRSVTRIIKNNIRTTDTIARLGGDEFAILLPETEAEAARVVIGKVQKNLSEVMEKNGWPVTFSIGVVTHIRPPNNLDELIKKADALMYSAKNSGKNNIQYRIFESS
jgi:diguanylate cyclase (GGDEF)-like protein